MKEFKPAIRFVLIFLVSYLIGNLAYGLWINSLLGTPDFLTVLVSKNTSSILNSFGFSTMPALSETSPVVFMKSGGKNILNIYEGCNGVNVMIVFVSFLFAFNEKIKALSWFVPVGVIIIHFFNLIRIVWLFRLAISGSHYFYYFHKYFFTAIIYVVVFSLWGVWIAYAGQTKKNNS